MKNDQKGFSLLHIMMLLIVAGLIITAGFYVYSKQNKSSEQTLNEWKDRFPFPSNFQITSAEFTKGSGINCLDVCDALTVYGVFDKATSNTKAFAIFKDSLKNSRYKFMQINFDYNDLSIENITGPNEERITTLQVWPEPPIIPGGGGVAPDPVPESPTEWVKIVFE